jgi:3-oxoacyl-[acyl-carrier protein] reductase
MESNDKVAVVTGASRGIGRATALELAREGMGVVVNYQKSADQAAELVYEINQITKGIGVRANVADRAEVQHLHEAVLREFGRVDVLVNNAGAIPRPNDWQQMTDDIWQRTFDINLKGVFNGITVFAPQFLAQQRGKIINVASTAGFVGFGRTVAYSAAKAGVINLTRTFAKELAPYVTVNAVAPAHIQTDMIAGASQEVIQAVLAKMPLGRLGTPEDVAGVIAFLASPAADFITGQVIAVDGGDNLK